MKLIGLSGQARSGKDTVGANLIKQYNYHRYAFADPLKKAGSEMFGIPLDDFYADDKKEVDNEFWGISPRRIAQLLGTEGGRELFRQDIWVKRAEYEFVQHKAVVADIQLDSFGKIAGEAGMVITDVRFPNEAAWIREMGGTVIDIVRPGADGNVGVEAHASEAGYPDELKDYVIQNDGTLADLYLKVNTIMNSL